MNRKIFYLFLALIIASLSLGTAHPVSAEGPEIVYVDASREIPDIGTCQDPVTWKQTGYYTIKYWWHYPYGVTKSFEGAQHVQVTLSANGKSLSANIVGPLQYRVEWVTDTFSESYASYVGPIEFAVAPRMGPVFGFTGRIVDHWHTYVVDGEYIFEWQGTVKQSGKSFYDLPAFCAYFGSVPKE